MSIFNTPFLSQLADTFKRNKEIKVYTNQTTIVGVGSSSEIDVKGYDTIILEISGSSKNTSIRAIGWMGSPTVRYPDFLPVYDLDTGALLDKTPKGSASSKYGIDRDGTYIINVAGYDKIRLPLYAVGDTVGTGISLRASFSRTFLSATIEKPVFLNGSKTKSHVFSMTNLDGSVSWQSKNFFEPRDANSEYRLDQIPHFSGGIFEQSFLILNSLDVDIYEVKVSLDFSQFGEPNASKYFSDGLILEASLPKTKGIALLSDKSDNYIPGFRSYVIMVPELRLPVPNFRISYKTIEKPTTGKVEIISSRRY